jgi:hypothetical protein
MRGIIRKWAAGRAGNIATPSKRVAIMVPLPSPVLSADDEVSMRHLRRHLDHYDKFLLVPRGMEIKLDGFSVIELDHKHFGSAANHNRMLYLVDFWEKFSDYEFMLMYHLDALVFSDQLREWCDKGYDYIGAPFMHCEDSPWVKKDRVGNGGFALYRIPSVLKVLWNRYAQRPSKYYEDHFWPLIEFQRNTLRPVRAAIPGWLRGRLTEPLRQTVKRFDHVEANEIGNDSFWSDEAQRYYPEFKVAPFDEGLRFAFEVCPDLCLVRNGGEMPFGCHAWARYNKSFWEPHLIQHAVENGTGSNPATVQTRP